MRGNGRISQTSRDGGLPADNACKVAERDEEGEEKLHGGKCFVSWGI